jgi:hypothetical protein
MLLKQPKYTYWLAPTPTPISYNKLRELLKTLPGVDGRISHEIASDYVYLGTVGPPPPENVAEVLTEISEDACKSLRFMRYFTTGRRTPQGDLEAAKHGFLELYQYLDGALSPEEKTAMAFDPVMLMDALTKMMLLVKASEPEPKNKFLAW